MSVEASKGGDDQAMELTNMLDLRMRGETGAIAAVTDAVSDKLIHLDVPEEKRLEIALAVQEAWRTRLSTVARTIPQWRFAAVWSAIRTDES